MASIRSSANKSLDYETDDYHQENPQSESPGHITPRPDANDHDTQAAPWRALLKFTNRSHLAILTIGIVSAIICGTANPAQSLLLGKAFGLFADYKIGRITGHELLDKETQYVFYLLAVAAASWVAHFAFFACWMTFGELQAKSAREMLFATLLKKEQTWYDTRENGAAALVSRTHQQVRELQLATSQPLGALLTVIADVCFSVGLAMFYSWKLTLVIISTMPVMLGLLAWLGTRMQSHVNAQHESLSQAIKNLQNALEAIDVVKCFVAETLEATRYMTKINQAAGWYRKMANVNAQQAAVTQFIGSAMFVQGFYYGGVLFKNGEKSVSDVVTTFLAAMGAFGTISGVIGLLLPLEKGRAAGLAIRAILDDPSQGEQDEKGLITHGKCRREIEFQGCYFTYPTRPDSLALDNVSFRIPAGRTTYILGRSGSGKSTLAQLLLGIYKLTAGTIKIDGHDIDEYSTIWLRNNITLVEQSPSLFDLSTRENIALGSWSKSVAEEANIIAAAEFVQLDDLIQNTQTGLDTPCGRNGGLLSGGQRQRVAIARARLRDAPILILDEPTSALDHLTRTRLMNSLRRWRTGKTTVIVTHDHSLLHPDDVRVVLDEGQVISGTAKRQSLRHVASHNTNFSRPEVVSRNSRTQSRLSTYEEEDHEAARRHRASFVPSMFGGGNVFGTSFPVRHTPSPWAGNTSSPAASPFEAPDVVERQMSNLDAADVSWKRTSMAPLRAIFAEAGRFSSVRRSVRIQDIRLSTLTPIGTLKPDLTSDPESPSSPVSSSSCTRSLGPIFSTIWPNLSHVHRIMLVAAFLLCIIHAAITPVFAYVLSKLIATYSSPNGSSDALIYAMAILGLAAADASAVYGMHILFERVGQVWIDSLRAKAVRRILAQPKAFFTTSAATAATAAVMAPSTLVSDQAVVTGTTTTNQIPNSPQAILESLDRNAEETRNLLGRFASLAVVGSAMVLASLGWALVTSPKLTGIILVAGPYIFLVTRVYSRVNSALEQRCADAAEHVNACLNAIVGGITTVKTLLLEDYFAGKYKSLVTACFRMGYKRALGTGFFYGLTEASGALVQALVFYVGAWLLTRRDKSGNETNTAAAAAAAAAASVDDTVQVFLLVIMTTTNIANILAYVPQVNLARDAATRFLRLVELGTGKSGGRGGHGDHDQREVQSHEHAGKLSVGSVQQIHFRDVWFGYPGAVGHGGSNDNDKRRMVLQGLNLFIEPGTSTAIVGPSGCGKSTILSLLLKLYPLEHDRMRSSSSSTRRHEQRRSGRSGLFIYASLDELKKTIHEFSKSHGYELVIKSGLNNKQNKVCRLDFRCKRHGVLDNKRKLTDETRKRKKRPSIKTGCKFRLIAAAMKRAEPDGPWQLRHPESGVFAHNHPADEVTTLSGHRKRDLADLTEMISVMHRTGITPAQILTVLSQLYKDKAIVAKDVYNIIQASQTQSPYTTPGKRGRPPGPARQSLVAAATATSNSNESPTHSPDQPPT